jgi:hypothetical protein
MGMVESGLDIVLATWQLPGLDVVLGSRRRQGDSPDSPLHDVVGHSPMQQARVMTLLLTPLPTDPTPPLRDSFKFKSSKFSIQRGEGF